MDERIRGFKIVIRKPNGTDEEFVAHCEKVLVGSGAHCEVRLPIEHSQVEHIELTIDNDRVYARARAFKPPPMVGGSPFVKGFIDPGVEIGIGPLRILASMADTVGPATAQSPEKKSNVLKLAGLGGIGILLMMALAPEQNGSGMSATAAAAPPLWGPAVTACPQSSPAPALALAEERRRVAEGKRERRPFHVQDGVAAVPLFEIASVCYAAGGDAGMASAAAQAASELRAKMGEDYHAHQVRLEHALSVKDGPTVLQEATALRAMTDGLTGPYVSWLSDVQRAARPEPKAPRKVL